MRIARVVFWTGLVVFDYGVSRLSVTAALMLFGAELAIVALAWSLKKALADSVK